MLLYETSFSDTTFMDGRIGFHVASQRAGFMFVDEPEFVPSVGVLGLVAGLLGVAGVRRLRG